jgi:hypothetical protein
VAAKESVALVPIHVVDREAAVDSPIEVAVRGGRVVRVRRGFDAEAFAAVVRMLEGAC